MLDELLDLFLRALKCDNGITATTLVDKWNEAVKRVQNVFDNMTDKALKPKPEREEGKWMMEKTYEDEHGNEMFNYFCSECGVPAYEFSQPYCHKCGAKMKKTEAQMNLRDFGI